MDITDNTDRIMTDCGMVLERREDGWYCTSHSVRRNIEKPPMFGEDWVAPVHFDDEQAGKWAVAARLHPQPQAAREVLVLAEAARKALEKLDCALYDDEDLNDFGDNDGNIARLCAAGDLLDEVEAILRNTYDRVEREQRGD